MFTYQDFEEALKAYEQEIELGGGEEFTQMRKEADFFKDITSKEDVKKQIEEFINIISEMNRESYACRYVVQTLLLDFCKYLEKDFLFKIKDHSTFLELREKTGKFIADIRACYERFTKNIALHTTEHLLEDYALLLRYAEEFSVEGKEEKEESSQPLTDEQGASFFWDNTKLW